MLSWQWVSTEDRQLGSLSGSHGSRWRSWRRPRIRPYSHLPTYAANKLAVAVFSRAPTPTAHIETTVVKHSINQVCFFVFFCFVDRLRMVAAVGFKLKMQATSVLIVAADKRVLIRWFGPSATSSSAEAVVRQNVGRSIPSCLTAWPTLFSTSPTRFVDSSRSGG